MVRIRSIIHKAKLMLADVSPTTRKTLLWTGGALAIIVTPVAASINRSSFEVNNSSNGASKASSTDPSLPHEANSINATDSDNVGDNRSGSENDQTNNQPTNSSEAQTNTSRTEINVNGQSIDVPENGSVHQTIPSENGNTTVDINVRNQQTGNSNGRRSSTNVQVHSDSTNRTSVNGQSTTVTNRERITERSR